MTHVARLSRRKFLAIGAAMLGAALEVGPVSQWILPLIISARLEVPNKL